MFEYDLFLFFFLQGKKAFLEINDDDRSNFQQLYEQLEIAQSLELYNEYKFFPNIGIHEIFSDLVYYKIRTFLKSSH